MRFTFHQKEIKGEKFNKLIIKIENQIITNQLEEERLFHLLQFLSFVKSLTLNPLKDCKKHRINKIISNGHYYFTKEFNTHDISEGFVIYEKLSI